MKTLLLMRHAKSSWKDDSLDDHDRPLNGRGKKDAPRMGQLLRDQQLLPQLIVSSDAKRCRRTVEKVAEAAEYRGETILTRELYDAPPEVHLRLLGRLPSHIERVLLVGHNPALEELLELLIQRYEPFSTASLAHVEFESLMEWDDLQPLTPAKLVRLWHPQEVA